MRCAAVFLTLIPMLLSCAGNRSQRPESDAAAPPAGLSVEAARQKLERISKNRVQLWVVVHVRAHKTLKPDGTVDEAALIAGALRDADAVVDGGGDAIIVINSRCEMPLYERVIAAVRAKHPKFPLGISALAYGPENLTEGFRLAQNFAADIVWCEVVPGERIEFEDDDGTYKQADVVPLSLALSTQQKMRPSAMHVAGVHMKYTRPLDGHPFDEAMRVALGSVDGINITGPQTAVLADVQRVRAARAIAGRWPMGLASGVSVDNIASVIDSIDYAIVGTSLKESDDPLRTSRDKVRALRAKMDELGGGPK